LRLLRSGVLALPFLPPEFLRALRIRLSQRAHGACRESNRSEQPVPRHRRIPVYKFRTINARICPKFRYCVGEMALAFGS
jgi:hypothetical protein